MFKKIFLFDNETPKMPRFRATLALSGAAPDFICFDNVWHKIDHICDNGDLVYYQVENIPEQFDQVILKEVALLFAKQGNFMKKVAVDSLVTFNSQFTGGPSQVRG